MCVRSRSPNPITFCAVAAPVPFILLGPVLESSLMGNDLKSPRVLGRSRLTVARLGFGSSFGAPASAYERAFEEHGCNYFYWGSLRREGMGDAIRHIASRQRERLVVILQSYSRTGLRLRRHVDSGLRRLKLDYADVLVLGLHNKAPAETLMDRAMWLKDQGKVHHLAVSGHHRPAFQQHVKERRFEILMVRYNASHRGAELEVFPHVENCDGPRPGVVTYTATRWRTLLNPRYTPPGHKTPSAVDCYRFVLTDPAVDVCLCGPASAEQMETDLKALELGPMSEEEMQWMRTVGDHVHRLTAHTWRNPFMQRVQ